MPDLLADPPGGREHTVETRPEKGRPATSEETFAQLRSIIVGPEQRKLRALQKHVRDQTIQTREVSRVLPDALQLRAHDPQLKRALAPSVEEALSASVARNPQALADALFPVIGPAIRKAVAHSFDAMIESINQTIERTVSWNAVQWRWTAWRTGRPYAEVVIANTLDYRVEQVFLIHRESGLLLQHVTIDPRASADADQISAMLTAITDFARDSFHVGRSDALESLRVGDLAVSIEQGPYAILAAVVRGSIPPPVRGTFETTLESIHRQFGTALQEFEGDAAPFVAARPLLESCLVSQRRGARTRPSYRGWVLAAALLLLTVVVWQYFAMRERQRWNAYLERIQAEPGVVLLASGRRDGSYYVTGLRDPLAPDPATLIAAAEIAPGSIDSRWEPYQALHPPFITTRASLLLRPPAGVAMTFAEGVLTATGTAPQRWIDEAERLAPAVAGIRAFRFDGESVEQRLATQIEGATIHFAKGLSSIQPAAESAIASLIAQLRELDAALASANRRASIDILGYTDSDGPDALNAHLSQARADRVRGVLERVAFQRLEFSARGLGRASPMPSASESEAERNRRISLRVQLTGDQAAPGVRP